MLLFAIHLSLASLEAERDIPSFTPSQGHEREDDRITVSTVSELLFSNWNTHSSNLIIDSVGMSWEDTL